MKNISSLGSEKYSVRNPIIKYVAETSDDYISQQNNKLFLTGWEYINSQEAERLRGGKDKLILREIFTKQILKLNSDFIDNLMIEELIKKIEFLPPVIEGNFQAWEYLKGLKTIYVPQEKRERNVKLLDENPQNNVFHVTDEFTYTNGKYTNRFDIVFLINGIPVLFVETKAAHRTDGISFALKQVERYHEETPEALTLFQIYSLTQILHFYYSATWNFSTRSLFNWKS